ncbi:Vacuolar-sorting protein SNF8 [Trichoplax sp. H2]|uniref:Vacuolar-sorting protein SNF8 n=1 Tax=Trichoplax adhaerens TaxID=10228 RepID=B3RR27_TRIAD|nr:expressed hypothetical protein [Trichoplax adhaerens]EDV26806.1 expressed hypothetical protein [Trichoplax adhaerens]RDD42789.1 Vacuolar-sorting protein SNF8 [Trichoplax sp. H2]|eukprot:XP_002110802.1 expressed hypothetical protein [Trichoplax adhaerens]
MRRRGVGGVAAINKSKLAKAKFAEKGTEIAETQVSQMSQQLEEFRTKLSDFAAKHRNEIRKNPQFRNHFQQMCARIGVDPLASSKGFWAELLNVGDFYYELGVQVIEVCMATRPRNGGIIPLEELRVRLTKAHGKTREDVTVDDLSRAIKKLSTLGNGFKVIAVGSQRLVQSVPVELSMDNTAVLQSAMDTGYASIKTLCDEFQWPTDRARRSLEQLIKEGMVWIDSQNASEDLYWFPGLFNNEK